MPFRTMLCLFAAAGILAAGGQTSFTGPKELSPEQAAKLMTSAAKQCSIPLKWAKIQKNAPDPRGEKWIGPHPGRIDPMYAAPPAPVCLDAELGAPAKAGTPSK